MPEPQEKRCQCGALLCKISEGTVQLKANKGMAEFKPAGDKFKIACICGRDNWIETSLRQTGTSGTLNRIV